MVVQSKRNWYLILMILPVLFMIPQRGEAKLFRSPGGDFSVNFPATPSEKKADKKTFVGTIRETWFETKTPKGTFLVGYTHLPGIMVFIGGHQQILKKAKGIFLDKEGAQQVSFSDTDVDGRKSKILVFKKTDGEMGKAYFIFEKHRVYLVMATSPKGMSVIDPFLTSFRLSEETKDKPAVVKVY